MVIEETDRREVSIYTDAQVKSFIRKYVLEDTDMCSYTFFDSVLRNRADVGFDDNEIIWLKHNLYDLKKCLNSKVCCGILYLMNKKFFTSTQRRLATRLGVFDNAVRKWLHKLIQLGLVKIYGKSRIDPREVIFVPSGLKTLNQFVCEIIVLKHGSEGIKDIINKNEPKSRKAIYRWFVKNKRDSY